MPPPPASGSSRLEEFLRRRHRNPATPRLPLSHTAALQYLEDILERGRLEPRHCKVMGRSLFYTFYGLPSYRLGDEQTTLMAHRPVAFVLRSEVEDMSEAIYPFDTGAHARNLFASTVPASMDHTAFRLTPGRQNPGLLVRYFYDTNENYVEGRITATSGYQVEVDRVRELHASTGNAAFDDRHHAIEVQIGREVDLRGNLLALILPSTVAKQRPDFVRRVTELGGELRTYFAQVRFSPYADSIRVQDQARAFLIERGYLRW